MLEEHSNAISATAISHKKEFKTKKQVTGTAKDDGSGNEEENALNTTADENLSTSSRDVSEVNEEAEVSDEEKRYQNRNCYIKAGVAMFLLAFIAFVIADSLTNRYIRDGMDTLLEWVEANPGAGVLVFMLVTFCTTLLFIPAIILTFGSGYVFANTFGLGVGLLLGTIAVFVGASMGAIASFLLGRLLLRDCVAGLTKRFKLFEAFDQALEEKGFRIMILLRLSPVIYASPYLNYGAGGTSVSLRAYTLALLAMLPSTAIFVFLGGSAGSLTSSSGGGDSTTTTIVLVVGIVFSFLAVALTTYYTRQELRKVTDAHQNQHQDENNVTEDGVIEGGMIELDLENALGESDTPEVASEARVN